MAPESQETPDEQSKPQRLGAGPPSDLPTSGDWLMKGFSDVRGDIQDLKKEIKNDLDGLSSRIRKVENKVISILVAVAVSVVFVGLIGWLLSPLINAVAERILNG